MENRNWTGTVEDFAKLVEHTSGALRRGNEPEVELAKVGVEHTSGALRRGNPRARIAAAGFVGGHNNFADRLLTLGMGKHIDILSVHYTDENPGAIDEWKMLLEKHKLSLPIWNSEEKSEVPIRNIAGGIERSFKFIHIDVGYPDYRPLVRKDWTVQPAGILFSVGAHCIGNGKPIGHTNKVPGFDTYFFRRREEVVGVFDPAQKTGAVRIFGAVPARWLLRTVALSFRWREACSLSTVVASWRCFRPKSTRPPRSGLSRPNRVGSAKGGLSRKRRTPRGEGYLRYGRRTIRPRTVTGPNSRSSSLSLEHTRFSSPQLARPPKAAAFPVAFQVEDQRRPGARSEGRPAGDLRDWRCGRGTNPQKSPKEG